MSASPLPLPPPVVLRLELDGVRAQLVHWFSDYAGEFEAGVNQAFAKLDVAQCVREQAEKLIPILIAERVRQRLNQASWDLVEKAWGRDKYTQALDRLQKRLRREALAIWAEDFEP